MRVRRLLPGLALWLPLLHALLAAATTHPQAILAAPNSTAPDSTAPLLDEILEAFGTAAKDKDCASCHRMLVPIKALAQMGDGPFVRTITQVCIQRKVRRVYHLQLQLQLLDHARFGCSCSGTLRWRQPRGQMRRWCQ